MKENLINLKKKLLERKNDNETGYMFINVNESFKNGGTYYSDDEYNKMIVPANMAAYTVLKYYEKQLENQKKLKYTTSNKVDLEIGIDVITKGKTYENDKRKNYKYEDMIAITPYAFTDLGPEEDRIYLEDVTGSKGETKIPYMIVNYQDFFKEMKDYGYDFGASTLDDLIERFKNSKFTNDDKILNPSLSIESNKQKKLI